ncbi:6-bladed beta-propeller protein [Breznakibacter xylanolyticus]|uniref:6-bladed beta-propeller protein n=1 Tax=Breznakibacter xylanolyticus TaxID=990 RepID=A0A2W7MZZ7_9BACT|nr:6-bladed beta-propeller [Breznakibacter xylanolyticus]PZX13418.1 6-bladed beta-propeller protein [Breznakibacter xylanolyticus]
MYKLVIIFSFIFIISCTNKKESITKNRIEKSTNYHIKNVDIDGKNMSIADYIDTCYYIPLETGSDFLINEIERVEYDMGLFFILDTKLDAIFIFNKNGMYLQKISKKGKGSNEYFELEDFFLNKITRQIEICDRPRKRILCYDYNGKYMMEKKFDFEIASRFATNGNQYFFHHEDMHSQTIDCTVFDIVLNKNTYTPIFRPSRGVDQFYSPMIGSQIAMYGKDIYSVFLCNPNVYKLNENGTLEIAFSFDFGITNIESLLDKYIGKSEDVLNDILLDKGLPTSISNFTIAGNTIYFSMVANKNRRILHYYYDFLNKEGLSLYGLSYCEKSIVDPEFIKGHKDEFFISAIDAYKITDFYNYYTKLLFLNKIKREENYWALKKATINLTQNSNPILMIFKPKL